MIVFGSRGSRLARAQTEQVAGWVAERSGEDFRIEIIETRGDRELDVPLPSIGGKGVFTLELEEALRAGRIDLAVHSLKDLPVEDPDELTVGAIPPRVSPVDVIVYDPAQNDGTDSALPLRVGCVIGTSSLRRRSALLAARPDLQCDDIRGNVPTRVQKVRDGRYGGVVLAAAGLDRLGLDLQGLERRPLPVDMSPPAPGQGALAVQCRADDERILGILAEIHDADTERCVNAERRVLNLLGGGCSMPLGVLVEPHARGFRLRAALFADAAEGEPAPGLHVDLTGADLDDLVSQTAETFGSLVGEPLRGRRVLLVRPEGRAGALAVALAVGGARVEVASLTRTTPLDMGAADLGELRDDCTVAFSSMRAVERFFEIAAAAGVPAERFSFLAAGAATARAVEKHGHSCLRPRAQDGSGGAALAELVRTHVRASDRPILFPCAEDRHPVFESELAAAGYPVRAVPVYRTETIPGASLPSGPFDFMVFTSPSAVRAYADGERRIEARLLSLGPTTAEAIESTGLPLAGVAPIAAPHSLVSLIRELVDADPT